MTQFRGPLFSQGSAWLPPWLVSDMTANDTPSIFDKSYEEVEELPSGLDMKSNFSPVLKDSNSRAHCLLCLSEEIFTHPLAYESVKAHNLRDEYALLPSTYSQPKALILQLSLSPREKTVGSSCKYEQCMMNEGEEITSECVTTPQCITSKDLSVTMVGAIHCGARLDPLESVEADACNAVSEAHIADSIATAGKLFISRASQCTGSTELYVMPAQQISPCEGIDQEQEAIKSEEKKPKSVLKRRVENHLSVNKCGKKVKQGNSKHVAEDVQAAIQLTVATAEALVIADVMKGCLACQDCGSEAILDAALKVKRGRELCGLDEFSLEFVQSEDSCDGNWTEGLDDKSLDEECLATELACACVGSVIDLQNFCEEADKVSTVPGIDAKEGGNCLGSSSLQCQVLSPANFGGEVGVQEGTVLPTTIHIPEECHSISQIMCPCNHVQRQMAPKECFSSRWLGGWTAMDCEVEQENMGAVGKNQTFVEFETSNLTEPCDSVPVEILQKGLSGPQQKGALSLHTSVLEQLKREYDHEQGVSAGSCAEILIAMSQASVKCSSSTLQEPLCSFVPCSIPASVTSCSTKLAGGDGQLEQAIGSSSHIVALNTDQQKNQVSETEQKHSESQALLQGGVKRRQLSSLKSYSTSPLPSLLKVVSVTNEMVPKDIATITHEENMRVLAGKETEATKMNELVTDKPSSFPISAQFDTTIQKDASNVLVKANTSTDQSRRFFEDSELRKSPPLTWHRGKKRRLRACRIIESALIEDINVDDVSVILPDHCPSTVLDRISSEIGNIVGEDKLPATNSGLKGDILLVGNSDRTPTGDNCLSGNSMVAQSSKVQKGTETNQGLRISKHVKLLSSNGADKLRGRSSTDERDLFKGLEFLLTGFPANKKSMSVEVTKKIEEHGGVLLSSVPVLSTLHCRQGQRRRVAITRCPIVVAPQKARTMKFLYGCAAGSLIVKPNWIDDCIAERTLLFVKKSGEGGKKYHHSYLHYRDERKKVLLFSGIEAFLHGERNYCSKLSSLVQLGGGKLLQKLRRSGKRKNVTRPSIQIVVVEHQSRIPRGLKDLAAALGLPVVSGDWIIGSLLEGRLLPLPAVMSTNADVKEPLLHLERTEDLSAKNVVLTKRKHRVHRAGCADSPFCLSALSDSKRQIADGLCIAFLGDGTRRPAMLGLGLSFDFLMKYSKTQASTKLDPMCLYYKAVRFSGVIYSAGDIVEIRPYTEQEKESYVAQIDGFYSRDQNTSNTRFAGGDIGKAYFMCCRWFYRPSDTEFPCLGTSKALYLSHHIDDNAPVQNIIRKASVAFIVEGKIFTNNHEVGWNIPAEGSSCTVDAADYICKYFYDYEKESLHVLKLTSSSPSKSKHKIEVS